MAYTLSRQERLHNRDFRNVRWAKRAETAHFMLMGHNNERGIARVAVTVRKKLGGAVLRNRMRRLVKEFFRMHKHLFVDGSDNLIRVKKLPQDLNWSSTRDELRVLTKRTIGR
jgi:ribonuclease P protein component